MPVLNLKLHSVGPTVLVCTVHAHTRTCHTEYGPICVQCGIINFIIDVICMVTLFCDCLRMSQIQLVSLYLALVSNE
jgi:hypothetical protein